MVRFACPRTATAVCVLSLLSVAPALAQDAQPASASATSMLAAAIDAAPVPSAEQRPNVLDARTALEKKRPGALVPLYVSFGALQVLDAHSTSRALGRGGVEANPVMKGIAGNQAGMLAVKAAGTAGVIFASEKMWKKNRTAAVIFMVASNAAMAWVVQHNYRAGR
jgi:hypothetical protein